MPLADIATQLRNPCFVYSRAALEGAFREFDAAFAGIPHLVCYAMKANSNLGVLNLFARLGSGFDIVSGGELARVIAAGGEPAKIVFSGVGKTDERNGAGAGALDPLLQRRIGQRTGASQPRRRAPGQAGAGQLPRQSRRRSQDPSLHIDRAQGKQVRRGVRRRARAVTAVPPTMPHVERARNRHAHRLADHRTRARTSRPPRRLSR